MTHPQAWEEGDVLWRMWKVLKHQLVPIKATEILQELDPSTLETRLGETGVFSLEKRIFQGDLRAPSCA